MKSRFAICRLMHGWKYEWIDELLPEVYEVLLEMITEEQQARDQ